LKGKKRINSAGSWKKREANTEGQGRKNRQEKNNDNEPNMPVFDIKAGTQI